MSDIIRVLLADDHPVVRRGLKATIEDDEKLRVIAEAGDGNDALQQIEDAKPDVAILDIDMPGLNGLGRGSRACWKNECYTPHLHDFSCR